VRTCLRSAFISRGVATSPAMNARVSRPAPSGTDVATVGRALVPRAISKDPPPMSRSRIVPAPQPNQRRTAKNVMAASWSPASSVRVTPERDWTWSSTASPLPASRIAEVANASRSSAPASAAKSRASTTKSVRASRPESVMLPAASWCWTSCRGILWDAYGSGREPG
jgi:hypothetical protein